MEFSCVYLSLSTILYKYHLPHSIIIWLLTLMSDQGQHHLDEGRNNEARVNTLMPFCSSGHLHMMLLMSKLEYKHIQIPSHAYVLWVLHSSCSRGSHQPKHIQYLFNHSCIHNRRHLYTHYWLEELVRRHTCAHTDMKAVCEVIRAERQTVVCGSPSN